MGIASIIQNKFKAIAHRRLFATALSLPPPSVFTYHPEPTDPGDYSRGLRWLSGEYFHEHEMLVAPNGRIWDMAPVSYHVLNSLHSFDWMDDLAAVGTAEADKRIRDWTIQWIDRYGKGEDPAWHIETASWRLIRLVTHAFQILRNGDIVSSEKFYQTLGVHVHYIRENYGSSQSGLERIVALTSWIFAALALEKYADDLEDLIAIIKDETVQFLDGDHINLTSRNPEELSEIFCLLVWIGTALRERGINVGEVHNTSVNQIGKTIRALRLGTGKLVEAQGGGPGHSSAIERAMSIAQIQGTSTHDRNMGYASFRAGKLNVLIDCDAPAHSEVQNRASASTTAMWVSDGNHMLIGSEGCARNHNLTARISTQETAAYSTLLLDNVPSSQFEFAGNKISEYVHGAIVSAPSIVSDFSMSEEPTSSIFDITQDGYLSRFGLSHQRKVSIDHDGDFFAGVDIIKAPTVANEQLLRKLLKRRRDLGLPFAIQFILGPKIQANLDLNKQSVSLKTPNGKIWVFRQQGGSIELEDRQIYDVARINPIPTKAIIIHSRIAETSGYVSWSFQAYHQ